MRVIYVKQHEYIIHNIFLEYQKLKYQKSPSMYMTRDATKNMSLYSRIKSYYNFLRIYLKTFVMFQKRYQNYISVIISILRKRYPINAILKTGHNVKLDDYNQLYCNLLNLDYDAGNDLVRVDNFMFYGGVSNSDSIWAYISKEYEFLPVKDKVVIDIGSNIGDSSIYFATNGASKVIAIEPEYELFQFASKNIMFNGFSERIELINGICSNVDSPTQRVDGPSLVSLQGIIDKCKTIPSILKVDCEGCEYDVILSASSATLSHFTHIQIEYHYGYENLKRKLEEEGFRVKVTEPSYFISFMNGGNIRFFDSEGKPVRIYKTYVGMLYASRP